ncbi:bifunctional heptose 7-phosphate kinase/heptose 1-phosphate adenyltransferase [candidate division KSB1 bacterium]
MNKKKILELLGSFRNKTVGVFGDLIADEYVYGNSSRVSREAPVLILKFRSRKIVPGGGGNSALNMATLGAKVVFFGYADNSPVAEELLNSMEKSGIDTKNIIRTDEYLTPTKTRILAGGPHSSKQQVIRIDNEKKVKISAGLENKLIKNLEKFIKHLDAIVISDYALGTVSNNVIKKLQDYNKGHGILISVDSRYDLARFRNISLATPNEWELREIFGKNIRTQRDIIKYGMMLKEKLRAKNLIITQGSSGMTVFDEEINKIPIVGSDEVADVTGCGDTVIAAATLALSTGLPLLIAGKLANHAGGIAVNKRGTAPVYLSELKKSVNLFWE